MRFLEIEYFSVNAVTGKTLFNPEGKSCIELSAFPVPSAMDR
jgi:hypothetical protein